MEVRVASARRRPERRPASGRHCERRGQRSPVPAGNQRRRVGCFSGGTEGSRPTNKQPVAFSFETLDTFLFRLFSLLLAVRRLC